MFIDDDVVEKIFELSGKKPDVEEITQNEVKKALIEIERKLNFFSTTTLMHAHDKFNILIVVFAAFLLARFKGRKVKVEVMEEFGSTAISSIRHKMRWVLYLFFVIGVYRLTSILSVTGLDYSAMRSYYISSRPHFSEFELNVKYIKKT